MTVDGRQGGFSQETLDICDATPLMRYWAAQQKAD